MKLTPKQLKWAKWGGLGLLLVGTFVVVRKVASGSGDSSGTTSTGVTLANATPTSYTGGVNTTFFGDVTNPGLNYSYQGGTASYAGDDYYLTTNLVNEGSSWQAGNTAVLIDYGSPDYSNVLVNLVAPNPVGCSPCCVS